MVADLCERTPGIMCNKTDEMETQKTNARQVLATFEQHLQGRFGPTAKTAISKEVPIS